MLEILIGTDWVSNRNEIVHRICDQVAARSPGNILIVPDMISHDTERLLCRQAGDTVSRYAEVLSFNLLETRIAEFCGIRNPEVLDAGGRVVAMASAARSLHSRVKVFAGMDTKTEFLQSMLAMIDELKHSCIDPDVLSNASGKTTGLFAQKLEDMAILMETYNSITGHGKRDPGDRMDFVVERLQTCDYGKAHSVFIDGFPEFNIQYFEVVKQLILDAPNVTISLCCDKPGTNVAGWEKAGQTCLDLLEFAKSKEIPVTVTHVDAEAMPLHGIAEYALQNQSNGVTADLNSVHAYETDSIWRECAFVMDRITELVMDGARYRDIAIACPDIASYQPVLHLLADEYGIPLYISGKDDILQKPIMMTVLSALEAAIGDMNREDVLRYIKSPLSPVSQEIADQIENYAYIWNINGTRWSQEWNNHPDGDLDASMLTDSVRERLHTINDARRQAIEPLLILRQGILHSDTVSEQVKALETFLDTIHFETLLETLSLRMAEEGDLRSAQIMNQLWDILLSALDQMDDVLGNTYWEGEDFVRLLILLLSQYDVGTIPTSLDNVTAGNINNMRCHSVDHLFVLGVKEGAFPGYADSTGLLSNRERMELRQIGVFIRGLSLDKLQTELADIYFLLCGARKTLTLTSSSGQASAIFLRIAKLLGDTTQMPDSYGPIMKNRKAAGALLASYKEEALAQSLGLREEFDFIRSRSDYQLGTLSSGSVQDLYGRKLRLSASQIDVAANCKFQYFMQYGLRAKERKEADIDPTQFGTYVHDVMEHAAAEIMEKGGFRALSLEQALEITEKYSKAYIDQNFQNLESSRTRYLLDRNYGEVKGIMTELWEELSASMFDPVAFELSFDDVRRNKDAKMAPIEIKGGKMPAIVRGYVDRVDVYEQDGNHYFRVVDYKTGSKEFDYCDIENSVGLQMLLYLFALKHSGKEVVGDRAVAGGVMYFPARIPPLSEKKRLSDDELEKERSKKLQRSGLFLSDRSVLNAMENLEEPKRFAFKLDKNGDVIGPVADRSQWELLEQFVNHNLVSLVNTIAEGNIATDPYTRGQAHNPCVYCSFHSVCHSANITGRKDRKTVKKEEFWNTVREEVGSSGN